MPKSAEGVLRDAASKAIESWPGHSSVAAFDAATLIALVMSLITSLTNRCPGSSPDALQAQARAGLGFWGFVTRATVRREASRVIREEHGTRRALGRADFNATRDALADLLLREAVKPTRSQFAEIVAAGRMLGEAT